MNLNRRKFIVMNKLTFHVVLGVAMVGLLTTLVPAQQAPPIADLNNSQPDLITGADTLVDADANIKDMPAMPVAVFSAAASKSDELIVLSGGFNDQFRTSTQVQIFNLESQQWQKSTMQLRTPRAMHGQVTMRDGRILVAGGLVGMVGDLSATSSVEIIDPMNNRVTQARPMKRPMADHTMHLLDDGRVLAIGSDTASAFDPRTNRWHEIMRLRSPRNGHASTVLDDGRILVVGGVNNDTLELIEPDEEFSTMLPVTLVRPLDDLQVAQLSDGRIWICGGQETATGNTYDETYILELQNSDVPSMSRGPNMGISGGVADHFLVKIGQHIVVGCGESQRNQSIRQVADMRMISPGSDQITRLPNLPVAQDDVAVVAIDDRGFMIFGGFSLIQQDRIQPQVHDTVHMIQLPQTLIRR